MVTRDEVKDQLTRLMHEIANVPLELITEHATVEDELQMQSVTFVELQVAIEETYGIEVDPIRVVELNEFGAIVDYVHECIVRATE